MPGSYRGQFEEKDRSRFVKALTNEIGAFVIKSQKGPLDEPIKCESEDDILKYFGDPSATYSETFEPIAYTTQAPAWVISAVGDNPKWGGVNVTATEVESFSAGQDNPANLDFTTFNVSGIASLGVGDGSPAQNFTGSLSNVPVDAGSLVIKVAGTAISAIDNNGIISGDNIDPSETNTIDYTSGAFDFTLSGIIPTALQAVSVDYGYISDESANISHSFFARSPYTDDLKVKIRNVTGSQFHMTLYKTVENNDIYITEYDYSLIREKNGVGKNLYIIDIFNKNAYLTPKLNSTYTGAIPALTETLVALDGGKRGEDPSTGDYVTGWNYFKKPNKFPVKNFMDCVGNSAGTINSIIQTAQYYSHGISVVPIGNDADGAVTFRSSLGLDTDNVSLYTNWRKIYDPYNDSYAWISNVGSIGKKYAQMSNIFDALSPAGIDENGHGGQISDWTTVDMEYDYSDGESGDLANLDAAQVDPLIFDELDGLKIYGDKTLQVQLSDTSFIGTRRLYNVIIETVNKQVLRQQEFKNNDNSHRLKAKTMTENFLTPIITQELLAAKVICDESNNGADVKEQRLFILDIIVQATSNTQKTLLRLTRISQTDSIAEIIPL